MTQKRRVLVAILILVLVAAFMLVIESRRGRIAEADVPSGSIPVYLNDRLLGFFAPTDLEGLEQASFVDAEEGKTQEGWYLRDVLPQHLSSLRLGDDAQIVVSSSSREKATELSWAEVKDPANAVMFDLSSRGTLKLISTLDRLDTRDEWVQDVDRIEVRNP